MSHRQTLKFAMGVTLLLMVCLMNACAPVQPTPAAGGTPATATASLSTATPSATPVPIGCQEIEGSIERVKVPSEMLEGGLWISLYKPPCYTESPQTPYPVLYLLHGQGMDDGFWLGLGVAQIADQAISSGQQPFLMVMPYEERNFDPAGESKFGDALVQELLPWVEANLPVCAERTCRAIGGISRGGGWAVHLALRNFDTFGAVGAHSMGLMAGDWWYVGHLLESHTAADFPRLYVDRGEADYLAKDIDLFESALANGGVAHDYHVSPGAHEAAYWQAHVAEYMEWYMQGWQPPD